MNLLFENNYSLHMMTWETDIKKRNINNIITVVADKNIELNVNDVIVGNYSKEKTSYYIIVSIDKKRQSSFEGKNHFTIKTEWTSKLNPEDYDTSKASYTFKNTFDIS